MRTVFRHFAVGALVAFVATALVVMWLIYRFEVDEHLELGERDHVAVSQLLKNSLARYSLPLLSNPDPQSELAATQRARLHDATVELIAATDILKLKIFDPEGNEVFTSMRGLHHDEHDVDSRIEAALSEGVYSELVDASREPEFGAQVEKILQTYIALPAGDGSAAGVIELYGDLSDEISFVHRETALAGATSGAILCVLYIVLLVIVRRGDRIIERSDIERSRYLASLEQAARDARAGDRAKSEFLKNVSHEVRTPMNLVMGSADLLRQTPLDPKQADYVNTIIAGGDTLLALFDNILKLASIEKGEFAADEVDFRPREILDKVCKLFRGQARAAGLDMQSDTQPGIDILVRGDPSLLVLILSNLMDNAIKFTDSGWVRLTGALEGRDGERVWMRFSVADSGLGVESGLVDQLVAPFAQADSSSVRRHQGAGLGLTVVKRIVEQLGGRIEIDSSPGEGAKFSVILPYKNAV